MKEILQAKEITKTFYKNQHKVNAVSDINLSIKKSEIVGIVGESGSGKSTLLRMFASILKPDKGEIYLNGQLIETVKGKDRKEHYKSIQMVFQNPKEAFHPGRTIGDSIREHIRNLSGSKDKQKIEYLLKEAIRQVQFEEELLNRLPGKLSGGQCQRAAIARAISCEPQILLCDEMTSALDVLTQQQLIVVLQELISKKNITVVFVSHEIALVSSFCNRIIVMEKGKIVEEGETKQVLTSPTDEYTKKLLLSVI